MDSRAEKRRLLIGVIEIVIDLKFSRALSLSLSRILISMTCVHYFLSLRRHDTSRRFDYVLASCSVRGGWGKAEIPWDFDDFLKLFHDFGFS